MESIHLSFSRAVEAGVFKGISLSSSLTVSHLFYADDAVFIGEWSQSNLMGIMHILRCFSLISCMLINIHKSHILGVGIPDNTVSEAASLLGCAILKTPFKYLGIMVGGNMSLTKAWDDTICKLKKRLSKWKLKTLSIGGRLTLLKSVPKAVLNSMERLRCNFFYGFQDGDRKIVWIQWSKVLASKKFGGLGVSSFFSLNRALLFKWVWRFISQDNYLWFRLISAIHGSNLHVSSAAHSSNWSKIINEVNSLKSRGVDLLSHYVPTRWIKCVPIKLNVFAWRLFLDRLTTRSNLALRNVAVPTLGCPICDHSLEDSSHLFFGCSLARDILKAVCCWWDLGSHSFISYTEWFSRFKSIRLNSKSKEALEGVFYVAWWSIWSFRNQLLFSDAKPRKDLIFDDIILRSFNWCKSRRYRFLDWINWIKHPNLICL
nr:RNA-directed DNA polymerase, eukaryota [Tanacetum cinerariifolium]